MRFFHHLNIGTRMGVGFAVTLSMLIGIAIVAAVEITQAYEGAQLSGTRHGEETAAMMALRNGVAQRAIALRQLTLIAKMPALHEAQISQMQKSTQEIEQSLARLEMLLTDTGLGRAPERMAVVQLKAFEQRYQPMAQSIFELVKAQRQDDALNVLTRTGTPLLAEITAVLDQLTLANQAQSKQTAAAQTASGQQARSVIVILSGLALVTGAAIAAWVARSITKPLHESVAIAQAVAAGDLTTQIDTDRTDENGQLLTSLKTMNTSLVNLVGHVRHSSHAIASGTAHIATGNADVREHTERQASKLRETATSMEELTATVQQNAQTARQANELASSASQAAAKGGTVVSNVVGTMNEISASSRKISDIISVIDGIAFQTNILALNAAVEAARAGEQGRGFAVVAGEVRSLAQRSAEAAKEIKSLIGASVEKVEEGSRLVDEAGQSMDDIVVQVKRVSDLIGEISSASMEQSTGIAQVAEAITQIDEMTQQNASLVEDSATAAESLKMQAQKLVEAVSLFRMHQDEPPTTNKHGAVARVYRTLRETQRAA